MSASDEIVIGIDLGTTNLSAAYYTNGTVKIITNAEGNRSTPSCVYFTEKNEAVVGKRAQQFAEINKQPEHHISGTKRLLGQKFDDSKVQENLKYLSYQVESNQNQPWIVLGVLRKTPIEVTVALLTKVKTDVEKVLGKCDGRKAVITVPAYFNSIQKQATLDAANRAGFKVLKLLNEPTAAALKFFFDNPNYAVGDHFLVFDFGGGTCDVATLKKCADSIEIVAVDGDNHLGGHDVDNLIMNYVVKKIADKYQQECNFDRRVLRRFQKSSENAKIVLSDFETTNISLVSVNDKLKGVEITLTQDELNNVCEDLFVKAVALIDSCLKSGKVAKQNIKEIILAGGSSRIPKISKMIANYFGRKELHRFVDADDCVAEGAALQAAMLSKHPNQKVSAINIIDVTPLSLGVTLFATSMHVLIKRHSKIPISVKEKYCTVLDNQKSIVINVYEGERADAEKNRHLGTFSLTNLTPAPARQCQIYVEMAIDINGILTITANEVLNENSKKLEILHTRGQKSDKDVQNTILDAERHQIEDEHFRKVIDLQRSTIKYCQSIQSNLEKRRLKEAEKDTYLWCKKTIEQTARLQTTEENKIQNLMNLAEEKHDALKKKHKVNFVDGNS